MRNEFTKQQFPIEIVDQVAMEIIWKKMTTTTAMMG